MNRQIITALAHLECGDAEQAKRVLCQSIGLPPDRAVAPKTLQSTGKLQAMSIACELGHKAWQYVMPEDRPLIAHALHEAAKDLDSKKLLDAAFEHCSVMLFPDFTYGHHQWYAIEHNPAQKKNEQARIEAELRHRISYEKQPELANEVPSP